MALQRPQQRQDGEQWQRFDDNAAMQINNRQAVAAAFVVSYSLCTFIYCDQILLSKTDGIVFG